MPVSRDTLLRALRANQSTQPSFPRIIGIDDWAKRKGQRYGTIIVDLEHRCVIDLLPDREPQEEAHRQSKRERRIQQYHRVHHFHEQGHSTRRIARLLGISRGTVLRYLASDTPPAYQARYVPSMLDPYLPYLKQRIAQGYTDLPPIIVPASNFDSGTVIGGRSVIGVLAIGQALVMISGGIDLSQATVLILVGTLMGAAGSTRQQDLSLGGVVPYLGLERAILLGLDTALSIGFANGLVVVTTRIPPLSPPWSHPWLCQGQHF